MNSPTSVDAEILHLIIQLSVQKVQFRKYEKLIKPRKYPLKGHNLKISVQSNLIKMKEKKKPPDLQVFIVVDDFIANKGDLLHPGDIVNGSSHLSSETSAFR